MIHIFATMQTFSVRVAPLLISTIVAIGVSLTGCQSSPSTNLSPDASAAISGNGDKFLVVDCLLPGQVRKLGASMTYIAPRRPIKTTASECEIRGGEYVAYDRADYRTSLKVWLPQAKEGDSNAQNNVGEIYEKGLGVLPDYATAAAWYRKAAAQGNSKAEINLGFLYEKGLGVDKDLAQALNWYRKASGLEEDNLQFASSIEVSTATNNEVRLLRHEAELQKNEAERLRLQLHTTKNNLRTEKSNLAQAESELITLQTALNRRTDTPATPVTATRDNKGVAELQDQLERNKKEAQQKRNQIAVLEKNLAEQQSRMNDALKLSEEEITELQSQLQVQTSEASQLKRKLDQVQAELLQSNHEIEKNQPRYEQERKQLETAQLALAKTSSNAKDLERELAQLQLNLQQRESEMGLQGKAVTQLREKANHYRQLLVNLEQDRIRERSTLKADVDKRELEIAKLRQKLLDTQNALDEGQAQLNQVNPDLARKQSRLQQVQKELVIAKTSAARKEGEITRLKESQQQHLAKIKAQEIKIDRYQAEALRYRTQLAKLGSDQRTSSISGPSIEILDPPITLTRGVPSIRLRSAAKERLITGKVTASTGLFSFTVNDKSEKPDEVGIFSTNIPIEDEQTPVKLVAVDKQGQRATLDFVLIPKLRYAQSDVSSESKVTHRTSPSRFAGQVEFGSYHALIIGNNQYENFPNLVSASHDAQNTAQLLSSKYGFQTTTLIDATRYEMLSALNQMRESLTDKDNLLIYYAGHGELDRVNLRGHWLPVDAEPNSTANWISNIAITDILNAMSAKHILVVADSCYSGSLTRSSMARLDAGMSDEVKVKWLKVMAKTRSRTVLTSGGLKPVLDQGGGKHSVFAKSFLNALEKNDSILEAYKLYRNLAKEVQRTASKFGIDQLPEYAPIRHGGHEAGEFFFIPQG